MQGKVLQLNIKEKVMNEVGLPKNHISSAMVTKSGMQGDYNNYRSVELDDTPDQALLLMPIEMIEQLNKEGWPIKSGDIGENITTLDIPYNEFQPNTKFKIGESEFQISYACTPCHNLEFLPYVGKQKGNEFIKTMVNRRGWYARVLKEGKVKVGDKIEKLK